MYMYDQHLILLPEYDIAEVLYSQLSPNFNGESIMLQFNFSHSVDLQRVGFSDLLYITSCLIVSCCLCLIHGTSSSSIVLFVFPGIF